MEVIMFAIVYVGVYVVSKFILKKHELNKKTSNAIMLYIYIF